MTTIRAERLEVGLGEERGVWGRAYRRCFDLVVALVALVVTALPMCVIALAIKCLDGGRVFYFQTRLTIGGREFSMIKFRTMAEDAERDGPAFAVANDRRCTRVGRFLRATALDELPQVFNVLAGDMSIVGPRPERPEMMWGGGGIVEELLEYALRLQVKAGVTGWAQVQGWRGPTLFAKRLECDLWYIRNWSPWVDVKIVLMTPLAFGKHESAS